MSTMQQSRKAQDNRAMLVEAAMKQLANGESPDQPGLWRVLIAVEGAVV
ncbi:hypothetical protein [Pseudomonas sp. ES1]